MNNFKIALKNAWKKSYLGIFLAITIVGILASFTLAALEGMSLIEQRGLQKGVRKAYNTPSMSADVIKFYVEQFGKGQGYGGFGMPAKFSWPATDIRDFLTAEQSFNLLHDAGDKRSAEVETPFDMSGSIIWNQMAELDRMWSGYRADAYKRFGEENINSERQRIEANKEAYKPGIKLDKTVLYFWFVVGWLLAGLACTPFSIARMFHSHENFSLKKLWWGEIMTGYLIGAELLWLGTIPFYKGGNPEQAMRRSMRAVFTFATLVVMYIMVPVFSAVARAQSGVVSKNEYTLSLDKLPERPALPQGKPKSKKAKAKVKVEVSTKILPKYVGLPGVVPHQGPVMQTKTIVTWSNGVYVGEWHSIPLTRKVKSPFGKEVDLFVGKNTTVRGNDVDVGMTYVAIAPLTEAKGDLFEFYGSLSRSFVIDHHQKVSPYAIIRHYIPFKGSGFKGGTFIQAGVKHSLAIERFALDSSVETLHDNGAFGRNNAFFLRSSTELSFRPRSKLKLLAGVKISAPLTHVTDGRKTETTPYVGVSKSWQ